MGAFRKGVTVSKFDTRLDKFGMPLMEGIQEALSKKLWIKSKVSDEPILRQSLPDLAFRGYGDSLVVGDISAIRAGYHNEPDRFGYAALVWRISSGEVLYKDVLEYPKPDQSSNDAFYMQREENRKLYAAFEKRLDKFIEGKIRELDQPVELPDNLLSAVAPDVSSVSVPDAFKAEGFRKEMLDSVEKMYLDAKEKFIKLLPAAKQSIASVEIQSRPIRAKKSKDAALSQFFEKVTPSFVALVEKIKAVPIDKKKVIRDAASGFEIGEPVLIDHPKYGKIPGTVMGFKDGLVGVRHKNIDRQMRHYASVGTQDTYVEPSKVTSRKSYADSTPDDVIKQVRKAILDLPDIQKVRKDTVEGFIKSFTKDAKFLVDRAKQDGLLDKKAILEKSREIESKYRNTYRSDREGVPSQYPGIMYLVYLNDDMSINQDKIKKDAEVSADDVMSAFLNRSAGKIAPVINKHGGLKEIKPFNLYYSANVLHGKVRVTFENGDEFTTHSQLVWKVSILGKLFYQFPTTFNNVKFNGQNVSKPDEVWMNEVFGKGAPKQEDAAYEVRFQGWLEKNKDRLKSEYDQYRKSSGYDTMKFNDFALEKYLKKEASNGA